MQAAPNLAHLYPKSAFRSRIIILSRLPVSFKQCHRSFATSLRIPLRARTMATITQERHEKPANSLPSLREGRDEDQTFTLPNGRTLGFARYGAPTSSFPAAIYIHGYPASRIEPSFMAKDLYKAGLSLYAIDRPGFGLSSPDSKTSILDHARDVLALADHLGLAKFAVIGVSGGGPYALACSQTVPADRLIGLGIAAGMGPYELVLEQEVWKELWWVNKFGFIAPVKFPWLYGKIYPWIVSPIARSLQKVKYEEIVNKASFKKLPRWDQEAIVRGGEQGVKDLIKCVNEAIRQPDWAKSHVEDAKLLAKKWEFELGDIKCKVKLWYGDKDTSTPLKLGEKIAKGLPNAKLVTIKDAGHSGAVLNCADYVKELVGYDTEPSAPTPDGAV